MDSGLVKIDKSRVLALEDFESSLIIHLEHWPALEFLSTIRLQSQDAFLALSSWYKGHFQQDADLVVVVICL